MRLLLLIAMTVSSFWLAGTAQAQTSRVYLAGYLGLNLYDDRAFKDDDGTNNGNVSLDNAPSFAGALGLRISRNFRVEAELSLASANADEIDFNDGTNAGLNGEVKHTLLLANLYYDFDVPWEIQPFVSAGAGLGMYDVNLNAAGFNYNDDTTSFTWTAGAGLKYRPRSNMAFTAGYRYLDAASLEFGDFDIDYASHEIRFGLEYDLQ